MTAQEKRATLRTLLEARSGVYHSYVGGSPSMKAEQPGRGSHAPGTFWYYNNWDFNTLGGIFERNLHSKIGIEFHDRIGVQMQDFRVDDMYSRIRFLFFLGAQHASRREPACRGKISSYLLRSIG